MEEIRHKLNKSAFENALKSRKTTQALLAEKLGANPKSFSRWINEGFVYSKYIWDLTDVLNLTEDELDEILMLPKFNVFFRKKYMGEVPAEIQERAIEFGKTLFGLTYLNAGARFCPPNLSRVDDVNEIANQIRKYIALESFSSLEGIVSRLAEQGLEIVVIPFSRMGLSSYGEHEEAFSVTDGNRCAVFLDAAAPAEALIFNLCHELAHLFRPDVEDSKNEERLCNAVASELLYPSAFFLAHHQTIVRVIASRSAEAIINLVNSIQEMIGGAFFGIILRLKSLHYLSQKDFLHKKIIGYGSKRNDELEHVDSKFFSQLAPTEREKFLQFWQDKKIDGNVLFRFFFHLKNAAIDGSLSHRRFAELFSVSPAIVDEIIREWQRELRSKMEDVPDDADNNL